MFITKIMSASISDTVGGSMNVCLLHAMLLTLTEDLTLVFFGRQAYACSDTVCHSCCPCARHELSMFEDITRKHGRRVIGGNYIYGPWWSGGTYETANGYKYCKRLTPRCMHGHHIYNKPSRGFW